jgi:protease-4
MHQATTAAGQAASPPPPPVQPPAGGAWGAASGPMPGGPPARKRGSRLKTFFLVILILALLGSIGVNVILGGLAGLNLAGASASQGLRQEVVMEGKQNQTIATVDIDGLVSPEHVTLMRSLCNKAIHDDNIRAVLLRVNTPGGSVAPCDQIHGILRDFKLSTNKPVIVSMGSVAASGGYYISAIADEIVAEETTVTGSIGVIASYPILEGALDKIGVDMLIVRSNQAKAWKAAPNAFEQPAEHQIAELQQVLDDMHTRFENIVRSGRAGKLNTRTADNTYTGPDGEQYVVRNETEPFNGRIYGAHEAKSIGLIDSVGYFGDAVDRAAAHAGLTSPRVVRYRSPTTVFDRMGFQQQARIDVDLLDEVQTPRLQMLWKVGQ